MTRLLPSRSRLRPTLTTALVALAVFAWGAPARADQIVIPAAADGTVSDTNGDGAFEQVNAMGTSVVVRNFQNYAPPSLDFEDRGLLEFDLSAIPSGVQITSVALRFRTVVATGNTGRDVFVRGYAGNGVLSTADATATATAPLATYDHYALGLGLHQVSLAGGAAFLEGLLTGGDHAGLRLEGELTTNMAISSTELATLANDPSWRPALVVEYSPADTTAPAVTVSAAPGQLWPPNGKLVPITLTGRVSDLESGIDPSSATFRVLDEYGQVQPSGTVTLASDGSFTLTVHLQASRLETDRDGRLYRVVVEVADAAGNVGADSAAVVVLHDRRK